jgi:hypothetical protein
MFRLVMPANRKCLTPGAEFTTQVTSSAVLVVAYFPGRLDLSEAQAATLDNELHDAVEAVLARYWPQEWHEKF